MTDDITPPEGDQPSGETSWMDGLDTDIRGFVDSKGYPEETVHQDLAKSYYNLQKLHAKDPTVVGLPGEDADEETWGSFYKQLGMPSDEGGYAPEFAEGVEVDEPTLDWFRGVAHKAGLNNKQFNILANAHNEQIASLQQKMADANESSTAEQFEALKKDWGADLDANVASGQKLVRALGSDLDEATLSAFEGEVGTPAMMKVMAVLGKRLGEDDFLRDMHSSSFSGNTREQSVVERDRLMGDKDFTKSLTDVNDPAHKANNEKWRRLNAKANAF